MLDTYMSVLDLNFLSIYRVNGQEWPRLPGLSAQNPPRKLARGRDQDRLLVYLTLAGNVSYSTSEYGQIVDQVAETFYSSPGSLTFALKTAAVSLNDYLVECNMKSTGKGLYSIGALVLCSLRGNSMYIVQAGPTHVYHLTGDTRHLYDPQLAGKGLGLSQAARMYFSQVVLSAGDRLLMCAVLPPNWDKSITEVRGSASLETTRRRLLAITDTNVSALLVQATNGSGAMNILRAVKDDPLEPVTEAPSTPTPELVDQAPIFDLPSTSPVSAPVTETKIPENEQLVAGDDNQPPEAEITQLITPLSGRNRLTTSKNRQSAFKRRYSREPSVLNQPGWRNQLVQGMRATARILARLLQSGRELTRRFAAWVEKTVPRLLPENDEDQPTMSVSRTWAIFLAVAIPVLLFVVARVVYYQLGYEAQYKIYFNHAQETAQMALAESAPTALRVEWQATLDWLDKADQYQLTANSDSQKLRLDAQTALDNLDKIMRLDFALAFTTPLSRNLQVSRMSASESDIYLLDSTNSSVLRGVFNNQTYDLDGSFQCGSGTYSNGIQVEKLIDIIALPRSRATAATLLGIDMAGKLLYCMPGEKPRAALLQMPGTGWKSITAIAYDAYNLYVLDSAAHAVWIYPGTDNFEFSEPKFFFGEQVPVMLEQAIGMAVNGDDLYLLHADGLMTTCTFSHIDASPTRCNDPALYIDTRPGYEGGMKLSDGVFSQITFTSPPDPSVALLEPFTQSIYRFSPRALELQNQVRAAAGKDNPLPKGMPVTAMAFSPNNILFLFVNGQVYFSVNIP